MEIVELSGCAARCAAVAPPRRKLRLLIFVGLRPTVGTAAPQIKKQVKVGHIPATYQAAQPQFSIY